MSENTKQVLVTMFAKMEPIIDYQSLFRTIPLGRITAEMAVTECKMDCLRRAMKNNEQSTCIESEEHMAKPAFPHSMSTTVTFGLSAEDQNSETTVTIRINRNGFHVAGAPSIAAARHYCELFSSAVCPDHRIMHVYPLMENVRYISQRIAGQTQQEILGRIHLFAVLHHNYLQCQSRNIVVQPMFDPIYHPTIKTSNSLVVRIGEDDRHFDENSESEETLAKKPPSITLSINTKCGNIQQSSNIITGPECRHPDLQTILARFQAEVLQM